MEKKVLGLQMEALLWAKRALWGVALKTQEPPYYESVRAIAVAEEYLRGNASREELGAVSTDAKAIWLAHRIFWKLIFHDIPGGPASYVVAAKVFSAATVYFAVVAAWPRDPGFTIHAVEWTLKNAVSTAGRITKANGGGVDEAKREISRLQLSRLQRV